MTSACNACCAVGWSSTKVAVWATWNQYSGTPRPPSATMASAVGSADPVRDGQLHPVLGQLPGEDLAERVGGEAAQETCGLTQPGDGTGRVERAPAWAGVHPVVRPDDQIDEALTGDEDHGPLP